MARVDLFCVPEDRHRVILLVDLLERAGQSLKLHTAPVGSTSDPLLLVCTAAGLRSPWLVDLFDCGRRVVAVRLDDTPLPRPADEVINLQAWPARSADSRVGGLVRLLQDPASVGTARRRTSGRNGSASRRRGGSAAAAGTGWLGPAVVLGIALLAGLLIWMVARQDAGSAQVTDPAGRPVAKASTTAQEPAHTGIGGELPDHSPGPESWSAGDPQDPSAPAAGGSPPVAETEAEVAGGAVPDALETGQDGAHLAFDSSISHLCRAATPEAALAWLAVLDWRQRRRLPDEPCVHRLLERPGFEDLEVQWQAR